MGTTKRGANRNVQADSNQSKKQRSGQTEQNGKQRGKRRRNDVAESGDEQADGDALPGQSSKRSKEDSSNRQLVSNTNHADNDSSLGSSSNSHPNGASPAAAASCSSKLDKTPHSKSNGPEHSGAFGSKTSTGIFREDGREQVGGRRGSLVRKTSFRDSQRDSEGADTRRESRLSGGTSFRGRGEEGGGRRGAAKARGIRGGENSSGADGGMWQFASYLLTEAVSADNPDNDCNGEAGSAHSQAPPPKGRFWDQVPNFIKVPLKLEATLSVGLMICADSFLFNFTLLPLRTASGLLSYLWTLWQRLHGLEGGRVRSCAREDIVRASLLLLSVAGLHMVDISYLYHYIRGQMSSYIKLYVIFNVLEVLDKLFCSVGQDVFDKMATWSQEGGRAKESFGNRLILLIFLVTSFAYVLLHSTVLLVQVVTLNVAINSQNNALFTLLVANNFTELKGQVFKKFEENTLLQLLCADIVERFQLAVFLGLVTLQNLSEDVGGWDNAWLQEWVSMVLIVWGTEYVVDWIKHSFVTKFNKIDPAVYNRYRAVIWEHTCNAWRLRQPHRVARHVGFISLPLSCVVARVGSHSLSPNSRRFLTAHWAALLPLGVVWWTVLCLVKIQLYLLLLGHACQKHEAAQAAEQLEREREQEREREREREAEDPRAARDRVSTGRLDAVSSSHQATPRSHPLPDPTATLPAAAPVPLSNLMGVEMFVRAPKGQVDPAQVVQGSAAYPSPAIRQMPSPQAESNDGGLNPPKLTL